jgi:hypothetical protein
VELITMLTKLVEGSDWLKQEIMSLIGYRYLLEGWPHWKNHIEDGN